MAETYLGHVLTEAFADQIAVYDRGSFLGHFGSLAAARAYVSTRNSNTPRGGPAPSAFGPTPGPVRGGEAGHGFKGDEQ